MKIFRYIVAMILIFALATPSIMGAENRGLWSESNYVQSAKIHYRHVYKKSKRREDLYHCIDLIREAADRFGHRPQLYYMLGTFYAEINAIDTVIAYFDSVETFCADESIEEKYRKNCYKKDNYKKKMANLRKDRWESSLNDAVENIALYDTVMVWKSAAPTDDSAKIIEEKGDLIFAEAEEGFKEAILVLPDEARSYSALAALYQRKQMNKEMIDLFLKEIELTGENDEVMSRIAYAYISLSDWENTIIWFEKYLEGNPTDINALINLSVAYQSVKNTEKWFEYSERAIEVDPQNSQLVLGMGSYWYTAMQNATVAQGEIADSLPDASEQKAALENERIEAMGKSMSYFNRALDISPDNLDALRLTGILCLLSGDIKKTDIGIDMFERYVAINPSDNNILDYLGRMFIIKGDTKAAIKPYEMIVENDPSDVDAWERLSELYEYNSMPVKSKEAKAKADELNKI